MTLNTFSISPVPFVFCPIIIIRIVWGFFLFVCLNQLQHAVSGNCGICLWLTFGQTNDARPETQVTVRDHGVWTNTTVFHTCIQCCEARPTCSGSSNTPSIERDVLNWRGWAVTVTSPADGLQCNWQQRGLVFRKWYSVEGHVINLDPHLNCILCIFPPCFISWKTVHQNWNICQFKYWKWDSMPIGERNHSLYVNVDENLWHFFIVIQHISGSRTEYLNPEFSLIYVYTLTVFVDIM